MSRMLAESVSAAGWFVFVGLVLGVALARPAIARLVRRGLPRARRGRFEVEPVAFGLSPEPIRSPRHAVLQHRSLLTALFTALLGMLLVPGMAALRSVGVGGLTTAFFLVLPVLLVMLHARRRSPRS